jgi:hypothetical protein
VKEWESLTALGCGRTFRIKALIRSQTQIRRSRRGPGKFFVASYWLGIVCVVMTVIFRGLAALGMWPILVPQNGAAITYVTFDHAAEISLLLSIAAGLMSRWQREKSCSAGARVIAPKHERCPQQQPIWRAFAGASP